VGGKKNEEPGSLWGGGEKTEKGRKKIFPQLPMLWREKGTGAKGGVV